MIENYSLKYKQT